MFSLVVSRFPFFFFGHFLVFVVPLGPAILGPMVVTVLQESNLYCRGYETYDFPVLCL